MMKSIGRKQDGPSEIYCDNLSAVHLTANPVLHKKSKHFATHYHFAREKVADGSLVVKHIPASLQIADIFTKSLPQQSYFSLRFKLGVDLPPTSSLHGGIKASSPTGTQQSSKAQSVRTEETLGFAQSTRSISVPATRQRDSVNKGESRISLAVKQSTVKQPHQVDLSNRYAALQDEDA